MALHFRLYKQRQKELEAARRQVEEYARMKSELFTGMSHEMRTPLTVMSAYAQFAVEQIRESGANEQTLDDLATISDEAKRLAEMADGTLKILMSGSGGTDESETDDQQKNTPVDAGDLVLLVLSAKAKSDDIIAGLRAGGDDYMTKPYNISEFRTRVTGFLQPCRK